MLFRINILWNYSTCSGELVDSWCYHARILQLKVFVYPCTLKWAFPIHYIWFTKFINHNHSNLNSCEPKTKKTCWKLLSNEIRYCNRFQTSHFTFIFSLIYLACILRIYLYTISIHFYLITSLMCTISRSNLHSSEKWIALIPHQSMDSYRKQALSV